MLTPSKIKNHHFEASGKNAYRAQSVDEFFDIVADSYEQMFKENGELVKKISLLAERVEEYRNDEDNIRAALLTAQRMADQIMRETNEKAENQLAEAAAAAQKIEAEAAAKAQAILETAQTKADARLIEADATAKRLIEDATADAKEQAVVARDRMIKTQAALDLVEKEADAFKKQLLDLYKEHIELITKIPELEVEEIVEEEPVAEEPAVEVEETVIAPPVVEEDAAETEPVAEEEPAVEIEAVEEEPIIEVAPTVDIEPAVEEEPSVEIEEVIEDVIEEPVSITEEPEEPEEAVEEELTDEMLKEMGFDVPSFVKESAEPTSKFSFIDEEDKEEEFVAPTVEIDDGYGEDDGIKFDINSIKFGVADDEDEEFYDDDDDDDDYYDDDADDDDDDDDNFGAKLKGFFKR
ncbi:MAG: DivIVA domain-containing protein [Clostridia bacterium]|nr:DivIVA domain-containing protein [Clostridia bacterium]